MLGNKIAMRLAFGGFVVAFAAMGPMSASAQTQTESEQYHNRWMKPFYLQNSWDQAKIDRQNMRWDIKVTDPVDVSDVPESAAWHDRWNRPFCMQPLWDEKRIEDHFLNWHNQPVVKEVDLSDMPHSMVWHDQWTKPFYLQNAWDEQRWEKHCMNTNGSMDERMGYRHKDDADMEYRSE